MRSKSQTDRSLFYDLGPPVAIVLAGVAFIGLMNAGEAFRLEGQTGRNILVGLQGDAPWDGAEEISIRRVPPENYGAAPRTLELLYALAPDAEEISRGLDKPEPILFARLSAEEIGGLLASGRPPAPGSREVLAGQFTRLDAFTMDGQTFKVVGRFNGDVGGLALVYVIPEDEALRSHFTEEAGATEGWFDWNGMENLTKYGDRREFPEDTKIAMPAGRASLPSTVGVMAGMIGVAAGGVWLHLRIFRRLSRRPIPLLLPMLYETRQRPVLFMTLHVVLYASFFIPMFMALANPMPNLYLQNFVSWVFSEGGLSDIGAAYESKNILFAAWTTFKHNFLTATLLATLLPSLVIPFFGLAKTWVSFALAGFAIAPIWTGSAEGMTYHSITMMLELEAYILAAFLVVAFPLILFKGFMRKEWHAAFTHGVRMYMGGTALSALMLANAALYEATTLILLHF